MQISIVERRLLAFFGKLRRKKQFWSETPLPGYNPSGEARYWDAKATDKFKREALEILSLAPDDASVNYTLAIFFLHSLDFDRAASMYKRVIEINAASDPTSVSSSLSAYFIGYILAIQGDCDGAKRYFDLSEKIDADQGTRTYLRFDTLLDGADKLRSFLIDSGAFSSGIVIPYVEDRNAGISSSSPENNVPVALDNPSAVLQPLPEWDELLINTPLASRIKLLLPVLDTGEAGLLIETTTGQEDWTLLRGMLAKTSRWPVCVQSVGGDSWQAEDLFSRFYFNEEDDVAGLSPQEVIQASEDFDLDGWLHERLQAFGSWRERLEFRLEHLARTRGAAPAKAEVEAAIAHTQQPFCLERYLWDWAEQHLEPDHQASNVCHMDWFDPAPGSPQGILLLPTPNAWEALAYVNWYGHCTLARMALVRRWQAQFGAELVAHFGTMLQFTVSRPPVTRDEAFQLALEQYLVAPSTFDLPGISIEQHAACLMSARRWVLHERP